MAKKQNGKIPPKVLAEIKTQELNITNVRHGKHLVLTLANGAGHKGTLTLSTSPSAKNAIHCQVRDVKHIANKLAAQAA